ncbi:PorT family protein [Flavobacterium sp. ZT3R18]|uniref:porin family protein n=1 Tax=Flavobacterium sp. ZT3R18 TaxID=2594429 RepID=UPI00117B9D25|nr:porin family protein [Flavobacterium sp. ZT3R18]TRX38472.1 PorT family protein [Flavobacterium sp. ZT3R18]
MRLFLGCFLFLSFFKGFSQGNEFSIDTLHIKIDSLYREDQFYAGINYNSLLNKPGGLSQDKISFGFSAGFLRDMPVNKSRTVAIASGVGFSFNNYIQNMAITGSNNNPIYGIIPSDVNYSKNRFEQLRVEVPIEFRWRTSTPEVYKFWRIYGGFKLSYLLLDKSVYEDDQTKVIINNNKDFNNFLYGAYVSAGYNTINLYAYYGLNSLFKSSAKLNNESIQMNTLSIGVMFYIL